MRGARSAALLAAALLLIGCQRAPSPPPRVAVASDLITQARQAMARADYAASAALLRRALALHPHNVEVHYRLGVSASYLHLTEEAAREFEWIVGHAAPGTREVLLARDWLNMFRGIARTATPEADASPPKNPERASVSGSVTWQQDGSIKPQAYSRLSLKGLKDTPVEDEFHRTQTDEKGAYAVTDVVPGEYMLTNRVAGPPIWRLKVTLKAGDSLVLDLSPENSTQHRNDFPDFR
jgi:hypothetical protein